MPTSYKNPLLFFLCFAATIACSRITTSSLTPPTRPTSTHENVPVPTTIATMGIIPATDAPRATICTMITNEEFREINDLHALPNGIQAFFDYPIANKEEPFNPTDVIDPGSPLPGSRFIVAGMSPVYILAAIEHGGIAHYTEVLLFDVTSENPKVLETWSLGKIPKDLQELKMIVCNQ